MLMTLDYFFEEPFDGRNRVLGFNVTATMHDEEDDYKDPYFDTDEYKNLEDKMSLLLSDIKLKDLEGYFNNKTVEDIDLFVSCLNYLFTKFKKDKLGDFINKLHYIMTSCEIPNHEDALFEYFNPAYYIEQNIEKFDAVDRDIIMLQLTNTNNMVKVVSPLIKHIMGLYHDLLQVIFNYVKRQNQYSGIIDNMISSYLNEEETDDGTEKNVKDIVGDWLNSETDRLLKLNNGFNYI